LFTHRKIIIIANIRGWSSLDGAATSSQLSFTVESCDGYAFESEVVAGSWSPSRNKPISDQVFYEEGTQKDGESSRESISKTGLGDLDSCEGRATPTYLEEREVAEETVS
jgi:hypothetical protein